MKSSWWDHEPRIKFDSPTAILIGAPSNSGKTFLLKNILLNSDVMFKDKMTHILYCYGSPWQTIFDELQESLGNKIFFQQSLPSEDDIVKYAQSGPFICVLDDLMIEIVDSKQAQKWFSIGSHHYNMTLIALVQNIFQQGKVARTIALNIKYYIIFKNARDSRQIKLLGYQIYGDKKLCNDFYESYLKATSVDYGYLCIDLNNSTDKKYHLRSNILPGEDCLVYILDK